MLYKYLEENKSKITWDSPHNSVQNPLKNQGLSTSNLELYADNLLAKSDGTILTHRGPMLKEDSK